jgi:hypothetical protein
LLDGNLKLRIKFPLLLHLSAWHLHYHLEKDTFTQFLSLLTSFTANCRPRNQKVR